MKYLNYLVVTTMIFGAALTSCQDKEDNLREFTVTFEMGDSGSAIATQKVKEGEKVTKPEESQTRSGYEFVAWYREVELINEWNFEIDVVTANVTLYAKWEQKNGEQKMYTITVLSDENGTASANVTSADFGELVTLTATANSGHSFSEWQVIKGDIYLLNANPVTFFMPDKDVEVKAIFQPFAGLLGGSIFSQNNNQTWYRYEYDRQNRFTKHAEYSYYESYIETLNYNVAGDLIEYSAKFTRPRNPWSETRFSKRFDKIYFITTTYLPRGSKNVYGEIELNAQGLPIKLVTENSERYMGVAGDWSHTTVSLTWQNGNLTKADWEREDDKSSSAGTVTYTHDDKKTPFHNYNTPKWVLWWLNYGSWDGYKENYGGMNYGYNENNIISETREGVSTITYEYTYNDEGFPVSRAWVEEIDTYSETYSYK